ncbi:hypothetical protein TWF506_010628 [Arthrobotrys conoides]|uniref:Uncharacterized protein n=1 Tax=Arthrobotrys conoides TaxID=74498 RepID=A0AAN8NKT5_9PEZI
MTSTIVATLSFLSLFIGAHLGSAASIHGNKFERRATVLGENLFDPTTPWLSPACRVGLTSNQGKQWGIYPFGKGHPERPAWLGGQAVKDFFAKGDRANFFRIPQDEWAGSQNRKPCWNLDTDVDPSFKDAGLIEYFSAGYCFCQFYQNRDCDGYVAVSDGLPQTPGYIGLEDKTKGFGRFERTGNPPTYYQSFACFSTSTQYDPQCKITISNRGERSEAINQIDGLIKSLTITRNFNIFLQVLDEEGMEKAEEEAEEDDAVIEIFTGKGSCVRVNEVRPYTSESGIRMRDWEINSCTCMFYASEDCEGRPIMIDGHTGKVTRRVEEWGPSFFYEQPKIRSLRCDAPYGPPAVPRNRW